MPTCPAASEEVVIETGASDGATDTLRFDVALCGGLLESVTCTATEDVAGEVGVPVIWPLGSRLIPEGNEPPTMDP